MSETTTEVTAEKNHEQIFPLEGVNYGDKNDVYTSARLLLPRSEYDHWSGKPFARFTHFADTDKKVIIPFRGIGQTREAKEELNELDPETLHNEPLQDFYRHVYMIHRFGEIDQLDSNISTIMHRIKNEPGAFAESIYPNDEKARKNAEDDFYFLKLACLEKLHEKGRALPKEFVEELYEEAITTHPRSIHYALLFEKHDGDDTDYGPIAERVKERLLPQFLEPHTTDDESLDLLKWSFSNQELQTDLVRETLMKLETKDDIDAAIGRFAQVMEVYDITTYVQEYAFENEDFKPKAEMVLDFLTTHPVPSIQLLEKHREEDEHPRMPLRSNEPAVIPFRTEEHISAAREVGLLEKNAAANNDKLLADEYGQRSPESILEELDQLTPEKLEHELFRDFYRHMDMLSKFGDSETVAQFLPTIMRRGRIGVSQNYNRLPQNEFSTLRAGLPEEMKQQAYLKIMACLEACEEDPNVRLPLSAIKDLAHAAMERNPRFIRYALVFDERNKQYGEADDFMEKNIVDQCSGYLTDHLDIQQHKREFAENILPWVYVRPELYSQMLTTSLNSLNDYTIEDGSIRIVQGLAPYMGVEGIRKTLREYVGSLTADYQIKKYDRITSAIFDYMQLDLEGPVAVDLVRDVYDKVDMDGYKPNDELLSADIELVGRELGNARDVADIACGTGRHLLALDGKDGRHVTGYDLVPKHVAYIKSSNPEADVHEASWYDLPAQDGQFDAAIMLGRSFAHNTTISDAVACLQEMKRVIKDDGKVLVDLPDGTTGDYRDLIHQTTERARRQGMDKILPGTIIDSPDSKHYFDRYIPDPEAFQALCELAGLHAEQIDAVPYKGHGETQNSNIYWRLAKKPAHEHMSIDRVAELIQTIRTNRYVTADSPTSDQTMTALSSRSVDGE